LFIILSLSAVRAQEAKKENQQQRESKIPATLAEAHAALERILSPQMPAEIDAMPSESRTIQYHMGLGAALRNSWGLWHGSPLAKHMQELGFTHPDTMSGVILETFWCKRHVRQRLPASQGQQWAVELPFLGCACQGSGKPSHTDRVQNQPH
jgi:hypothetical protein